VWKQKRRSVKTERGELNKKQTHNSIQHRHMGQSSDEQKDQLPEPFSQTALNQTGLQSSTVKTKEIINTPDKLRQ